MESKSSNVEKLESLATETEEFLKEHTTVAFLINFIFLFIGCCLLAFGLGFNIMFLICLGVPTIVVSLLIWLFIGVRYCKFGRGIDW